MFPLMIDSGVSATTIFGDLEKRQDRHRSLSPMEHRNLGDPGKLALVGWQAAVLEIVHNQKDVDAMLERAQVHRIGEIIANVEPHPMVELAHL